MGIEYLDKANSDGTSLGQTTSDKISLYGVTPIAQRSGSAQAAVATTSISAVTTSAITPVTTSAITPVATTGITSTYSSSKVTAIVTAVNSLITRLALTYAAANSLITRNALTYAAANSLITRAAANTTLNNELRAALVALGAIKGSS